MTYFHMKSILVEAIQFTGSNLMDVVTFIDGKSPNLSYARALDAWEEYTDIVSRDGLVIRDKNGRVKHIASPGDWIIKGVNGEFHTCMPDTFAATYEPALS